LESHRADLRQFFQWCADVEVAPLVATRTHIELYRASMETRGLAPSTVDRRLSTVCGYYRFAHVDGRIAVAGGLGVVGDLDGLGQFGHGQGPCVPLGGREAGGPQLGECAKGVVDRA
jgi:Phage integrase, N-terminal SAM-like domain